jgi:hypothetical protein
MNIRVLVLAMATSFFLGIAINGAFAYDRLFNVNDSVSVYVKDNQQLNQDYSALYRVTNIVHKDFIECQSNKGN